MAKSIRFKAGMTVKINSEYTGLGGAKAQSLDQFDYKKGEHVELLKYDSKDETWCVKAKHKVSIWIKRKNLAPIEAEPQPFKVGDKVKLTNKDAEWASDDNVTTGVTYTVIDVTIASANQPEPYIKVSGGDARGVYWIECKNFKLYKQPKAEPKVMQAVCTNPASYNSRITKGQIYNVQEAPSIGGDKFFTVLNPNGNYNPFNCWQERFKVITEPAKAETPAPVAEAPKKRMAVCIDMSDSEANFTVGQVYEIREEDDTYYYLAEVDGKRYEGGMFKRRFKEIVDQSTPITATAAAPYEFKVGDRVRLTRKKSTYYSNSEGWFNNLDMKEGRTYTVTAANVIHSQKYISVNNTTINLPTDCFELEKSPQWVKEMECVKPNTQGSCSVEKGRKYFVAKYDHDDNIVMVLNPSGEIPGRLTQEIKGYVRNYGNDAAMFLGRFKEIPASPQIGDTLTERWLRDGTPRFYWGFTTGGGWAEQTVTYFNGDRKIEEIGMIDGRMAAKISGTVDIWIDLEELTGEKSTVDKTITVTVAKDKLAAFNKEVQALVAKYK